MKRIPYNKQYIDTTDKSFVLDALNSEKITTGNFTLKFEKK